MQDAKQVRLKTSFVKGISLADYMNSMGCQSNGEESPEDSDLLQLEPNQRLSNFAINQIDEDNYDESRDLVPFDSPAAKPTKRPHHLMQSQKQSPHKREMFRSLYGKHFLEKREPEGKASEMLSTLGIHNFRLRNRSLRQKEVEMKDKNKRHYQQLVKRDFMIKNRMEEKILDMHVKGVRDKIHDRFKV